MKNYNCLFLSFIVFFSMAGEAQTEERISTLLKNYFLSLPYDKKTDDWINEIAQDKRVRFDSLRTTDAIQNIFLRGYITNWQVFNGIDSIKTYIGKKTVMHLQSVNGSLINETLDTLIYLREIFYFPLLTTDEKQWDELHKGVLKDFRKEFTVIHPKATGTDYETIYFNSNYKMPSKNIATMEFGKIKERSLYFIILTLNFKTQPDE